MKFIKIATSFIIFNIVVTMITMPLLLFYGPFKPLRDLTMHTIVDTRRGPRVLSLFMSQEAIAKYRNQQMPTDTADKSINKLNIDKTKQDSSIEFKKIENNRYVGYVMIIHDPSRVKVVASNNLPETGERVSDMARRVGAIAAINAGGFVDTSWQGNGGLPLGITLSDGKKITSSTDPTNYVIGLDKNGALQVGKFSYYEVKSMNIKNAVSFFGPVLIRNGTPLSIGSSGLNPRTAIGQTKEGYIIFLAIDGRSFKSQGASYTDLQEIMTRFGAYTAVNLDGGSSTTLYYDGDVVNEPANPMGERYVPTSFVVTP